MATFNLKMDELITHWQRSYYEIEANSEEEAMNKILDGIEEPYDYEPLYTGLEPVEEFEILNSKYEVIYSSKENV
jgi:hypothetical protein